MADESALSPDEENRPPEGPELPGDSAEAGELASLHAKIAELEQSVTQLRDQLLRKAAEFENYKRRTENDYGAMVRFSTEEMISKLLPIIDDFERSMKTLAPSGASPEEGNFFRGIELIFAKFRKLLDTHAVTEMDVLGKPFNPELHDALLQVPNSDVPPHTILEVVDKGYMLHDKVIRHARVIVSSDQTPETGPVSEMD